jgi:hypothetical protein
MTRLWTGQPRKFGSTSSKGKTFFFKISRLLLIPTQPPSQLLLGALSPWANGNASDHSRLLHAKVKNEWSYTSILPMPLCHSHQQWSPLFSGRSYTTERQMAIDRERGHVCTTASFVSYNQFQALSFTER